MVSQVKTKNKPYQIVTFLAYFFLERYDNFSILSEVGGGKVLLNIYSVLLAFSIALGYTKETVLYSS